MSKESPLVVVLFEVLCCPLVAVRRSAEHPGLLCVCRLISQGIQTTTAAPKYKKNSKYVDLMSPKSAQMN